MSEKLPLVFSKSAKSTWYHTFQIPKNNGKMRTIEAPVAWLKEKQRRIYDEILLKHCKVSKNAFGCLKKRNVAMCAAPHVGAKYILKIDLKDCFPSIKSEMIKESLEFNGITSNVADSIVYYCTNESGSLPQGAPSSPSLANIVLRKLYGALSAISARCDLKFTGYMDDLLFSGDEAWRYKIPIMEAINKHGFQISPDKVVIMRTRKEVLGVCAAEGKAHTRLPKRQRNNIRAYLHVIRNMIAAGKVDNKLVNRTHGWIAFATMVHDQKAEIYQEEMKAIRELMLKTPGLRRTKARKKKEISK